MHPKDVDEMANSVDPDQTALSSGSALFALTCLSENIGSLRYVIIKLSKFCKRSAEEIFQDKPTTITDAN